MLIAAGSGITSLASILSSNVVRTSQRVLSGADCELQARRSPISIWRSRDVEGDVFKGVKVR